MKKQTIFFIVSFLIGCFTTWVTINYFYINERIELHKRDSILKSKIDSFSIINSIVSKERDLALCEIDSINNIDPKTKIKYITKYEKVKYLSADSIVYEFAFIFSNEAINK